MSTGIFRVIRWIVGLFAAVILLAYCGLYVAGRMGAFDGGCQTIDRVEIVDELRKGDQTFYLVYRIAGFRKYTETYELYATHPNFNTCGDSEDKPLDMKDIKNDKGNMVKGVLVHDTKLHGTRLEIRYTHQADEGVLPSQAKLISGDPLESDPEGEDVTNGNTDSDNSDGTDHE
jgi:hypothetical protein